MAEKSQEKPAKTGLELMREPFADNQISKMCRSTKKDNVKSKCAKCHGWHGQPSIELSYVGHAALTDRLLSCDSNWTWEPLAVNPEGLPRLDTNGGMWIKLTVCNVTRLGYGDAQNRTGGDGVKETIGDALRNAAMRFGAALDLWHKGDLHLAEEEKQEGPISAPINPQTGAWEAMGDKQKSRLIDLVQVVMEAINMGDVGEALRIIGDAGLDTDEKVALNTRLDSKTRSAMTRWRKENTEVA